MKLSKMGFVRRTQAIILVLLAFLLVAANEPTPSPPSPPNTPAQVSSPAAAPQAPYMSILFQTDFSDHSVNGIEGGENWKFVDEKGSVYYCISNYNSQYGLYPIIHFGSAEWVNYSVEARMRVVGGRHSHEAILTRLDENLFGYRHGLDYDEAGSVSTLYDYRVEDNQTEVQLLGQRKLPVEPGKWYIVRAEVIDTTVRIVVNGYLLANYNVDLSERGLAGIEAGPGTYMCIDYIVVRSMDHSPDALAAALRGTVLQNANVRLGPGLTNDRISGVYAGEKVYILGWNTDHTWVEIRRELSPIQGWMWAKYLEPLSNDSTAAHS